MGDYIDEIVRLGSEAIADKVSDPATRRVIAAAVLAAVHREIHRRGAFDILDSVEHHGLGWMPLAVAIPKIRRELER